MTSDQNAQYGFGILTSSKWNAPELNNSIGYRDSFPSLAKASRGESISQQENSDYVVKVHSWSRRKIKDIPNKNVAGNSCADLCTILVCVVLVSR